MSDVRFAVLIVACAAVMIIVTAGALTIAHAIQLAGLQIKRLADAITTQQHMEGGDDR